MEATDDAESPAPIASAKLAGTVNWGTTTVIGIFAGMLYGGSKEAAASVSKDAEVTLKLGSTEDKREQYRLMKDAMEKRFIRVTRGSIVGGVCLGMYFLAKIEGLEQKSDSEAEKELQMLLDSDPPALEVDFLELQKLN
ncbi:uncharacterized protein DS421_10g302340 [Arachis hypogaea]|nr:uncharacterized protein DS421_10g302340 [Arachis hypogaea]